MDEKQTFERCADSFFSKGQEIYRQRGAAYNDTWSLEHAVFVLTKATLASFGVTLEPEQLRLLQLAALCDVKDSRLLGSWNNDHLIDSANYRAVYCTLRDEYEANKILGTVTIGQSIPSHPDFPMTYNEGCVK